jgi:hypothetical protein
LFNEQSQAIVGLTPYLQVFSADETVARDMLNIQA